MFRVRLLGTFNLFSNTIESIIIVLSECTVLFVAIWFWQGTLSQLWLCVNVVWIAAEPLTYYIVHYKCTLLLCQLSICLFLSFDCPMIDRCTFMLAVTSFLVHSVAILNWNYALGWVPCQSGCTIMFQQRCSFKLEPEASIFVVEQKIDVPRGYANH